MSPEEQRIAIAEACGWSAIGENHNSRLCGFHYKYGADGINHYVPNYLNDLNAMHEAEAIIPDEKYHKYVMILEGMYLEITRGRTGMGAYCATAAQRAEAFLKTIGKRKVQ